ncbi:MAG: FAD-dependent oxidoreductase, partial [Chloroflexota bacterium]|nr:FAD-dependent oxidoreductase [Chloroflexota bacterium]
MTERQSFLIVGNGIASVTAAEILRTEDAAAEITVVADDPFPVYYRPALKDYLGGKIREEKLWARPINFYQDRRIRFLNDRVMGIEVAGHSVLLRGGQAIGYSRLLLAHGARASTLTCPGLNLVGVTTLRTIADYQKVLSHLPGVRRVVITGSGTLALESIETLRHRGLQVTHLLRRRSLWSEVLDPTASDIVLQQETRDGVDVRYEQEIAEIVGHDSKVSGIVTTTGIHISCEAVLLGIGIEPIIDFVKSAGIACGRGVKVDGALRTNAPDIYAAGDLIETADPLTGRSRVIGQWYPSIQQARAAAYSMLDILDAKHQFRFGNFYNASMLYGLDFASVGLSTVPKDGKGYQEIIADPQPRTYQKVILKNGIPVGMLALGDRRSVLTFKRAVDAAVDLSPVSTRLFAPDFKLGAWLNAQGVSPPILGVSREGAVAIKQALSAVRTNTSPAPNKLHMPQGLIEAILVPVVSSAPPELKALLKETYLSQTRVITVGRAEGASLPVKHSSISRRHAEISYANGHYVLRDLQSKNGTFVNGQRLDKDAVSVLKPGDALRFGDVSFAFQMREVDPTASMLLTKQNFHLLFQGVNGERKETEVDEVTKRSAHDNAVVEQTEQRAILASPPSNSATPASTKRTTLASWDQPMLNVDGSVLFPGTSSAVSADVIATMSEIAALVAVVQGKPQVFLLKQGKSAIIGRDKGNQITLADISVSRRHAEVFPGPNGMTIRDLGSSNGVQVNQTRIDNPYRLSHGDRINIGSVVAYFIDQRAQHPQISQS